MTQQITLYHNPRCSKSRQTLALLEAHDVKPTIRLYLEQPPSAAELREVLRLLDMPARALLRRGESVYQELGLDNPALSEAELIEHMVRHPILIERPIALTDSEARIGRPPENVLDLVS
ncbi:MAG TPA: arsenate reductase (glutaredoxin) [Hyphomicrobiales bacterium]|nr:arsenate reductase (glutaredoxin) [Hyphomicrobiales bacterium]